MIPEDFSSQQLDRIIRDVQDKKQEVVEPGAQDCLSKLTTCLISMRVALAELEHLDDEFHRGNIVSEVYLDRHKKLLTDYCLARSDITDKIVPSIATLAVDPEEKSRLSRLKDCLKSNKEFLLNIAQLVLAVVQIFGKSS